MEEAAEDGATQKRLDEARERLNAIWAEWNVTLDTAGSEAQWAALEAAVEWLDAGEEKPEHLVRAVQYLICDPEVPGVHKRGCWAPFKRVLRDAWKNVATQAGDVQRMQALLLAGWPNNSSSGLPVQLLRQAWEVQRGRGAQRSRIFEWIERSQSWGVSADEEVAVELGYHQIPMPNIDAPLKAIESHFSALENHLNSGQPPQHWRQYLMPILTTLRDCTRSLMGMGNDVNVALADNAGSIQEAISNATHSARRAEQDLLWWGQSRYSRALRKPYRRFEQREDVTFWAPFEAAALAYGAGVDVEPAASYVVEVLHALQHDVDERKTLRAWMESMYSTLRASSEKAPPVGAPLSRLAAEDALGMPVTWVRLQAVEKKEIASAAEAVALPLDEEIDRGQWATWIFREALLDLHLARRSTP